MRSFYIGSAKVHIMGENKMKLIRNYLTTEDMTVIIEAVLKEDSALNREIIKVGIIGQIKTVQINQIQVKQKKEKNEKAMIETQQSSILP
jgi:uncharacterized protein with GYD domain